VIDWEKELNEEQIEAVKHIEGPLLVLAGAGSGKTRVITYRISYLIYEFGISPQSIMAITFTNKAANEMKERIKSLLSIEESPWVRTFHSTCVYILKSFGEHIGISRDFIICDEQDRKSIVKNIIEEQNLKEKVEVGGAIAYISKKKNELILPEELEPPENYIGAILQRIYKDYQKFLRENNLLDFDDLLLYTVKLWQTNKDVLSHYQDKWHYIMIDEYQDTNGVQYLFTKLLASKYRNICVVGDDDQSIYGFRGSDVRKILNFTKDFQEAKVIKLQKNYRSTKRILEVANAIISNNQHRLKKRLYTENEVGEKIYLYRATIPQDEAVWVETKIEELVANGYQYSEIAILYRTNSQSRVLEEELRRNSIPYRIFGGIRFYERKEIKDILSLLRLVVNPKDELSLKRILLLLPRIGKKTVEKIVEYAKTNQITFIDALIHSKQAGISDRIVKGLTNIGLVLKDLNESYHNSKPSTILKLALQETNLTEYIAKDNEGLNEDRLSNIDEFFRDVMEYEMDNPSSNLKEFLDEITIRTSIDEKEDSEDSVSLMTIHNAKGLEFRAVFCVGLVDGILPHKLSLMSVYEEEEERRLFYVAITRAKERLFLSYPERNISYGGEEEYEPSRFLNELPYEHILPINLNPISYEEKKPTSFTEYAKKQGETLEVGKLVYHDKFGRGIVEKVSKNKIEIRFFQFGKKKLHPKYAKIKLLN